MPFRTGDNRRTSVTVLRTICGQVPSPNTMRPRPVWKHRPGPRCLSTQVGYGDRYPAMTKLDALDPRITQNWVTGETRTIQATQNPDLDVLLKKGSEACVGADTPSADEGEGKSSSRSESTASTTSALPGSVRRRNPARPGHRLTYGRTGRRAPGERTSRRVRTPGVASIPAAPHRPYLCSGETNPTQILRYRPIPAGSGGSRFLMTGRGDKFSSLGALASDAIRAYSRLAARSVPEAARRRGDLPSPWASSSLCRGTDDRFVGPTRAAAIDRSSAPAQVPRASERGPTSPDFLHPSPGLRPT